MRPLLLALLPLLLAAPAHALSGRVRVLNHAVTLEREGGSVLLLAQDGDGREVLAQLGRLEGLPVRVDGRQTPAGFVVTELDSPVRHEADVLVVARPGQPDQLQVVLEGLQLAVVGPQAALLRPHVGQEVQLRGWFFVASDGAQLEACAPVAARRAEGARVGRAARVAGALGAGLTWTVARDGRTVTLVAAKGVLPRSLAAFAGRDVEVEGTLFAGHATRADVLLVERLVSPAPARLTGQVAGRALRVDGREVELLGDDHVGLLDLLKQLEGKEVTVKGLASSTALHVDGVAGQVDGPVEGHEGFELPADGRVWISQAGRGGSIVTADGQPGYADVERARVRLAQPTRGLAGVLSE